MIETFASAALIHGAGGGGKESAPTEAANSLFSDTRATLVYAYSAGPVLPLGTAPDGSVEAAERAVYVGDTPLMAATGALNFTDVEADFREGAPSQAPLNLPAINKVETGTAPNAPLDRDNPYVTTIADVDAQAAEVTIALPQGLVRAADDGDITSTSVIIALDLAVAGGGFAEVKRWTISGKTDAPYARAFRVTLPAGTGPWSLRVRRITADSASVKLRNATTVARIDAVTYANLSYPSTALVGLSFLASEFGGAEALSVQAYGRLIQIPSGYDPLTRAYPALWDGSFSWGWSDNPVWVALDVLTDAQVGLGLPLSAIDVARFYEIAAYCDELVDDGFGGQEPRFTFNGQITQAGEPAEVLQQIAGIWRGLIVSTGALITATCDMPSDPTIIVHPGNVIGGRFSWSTAGERAKSSVFQVRWVDPARGYREAIESVSDPALLRTLGHRVQSVDMPWCTSQGQAARLARWLRYTQAYEQELVTYEASLDHFISGQGAVLPGQIIALRDPARAGTSGAHGRLVSAADGGVTLDRDVSLEPALSYTLEVMDAAGTLRAVAVTQAGARQLSGAFDFALAPAAPWLLTWAALEPELVRVLAVEWTERTRASVTAVTHNPAKFAAIEEGLALSTPQTSLLPTGDIAPPADLAITGSLYAAASGAEALIRCSWSPSPDVRVTAYDVWVTRPGEDIADFYGQTQAHFLELRNQRDGTYTLAVRARTPLGARSIAATVAADLLVFGLPPADVQGFDAGIDGGQTLLTWRANTDVDLSHYEIRHSPLTDGAVWGAAAVYAQVPRGTTAKAAPAREGTYLIKAIDTSAVESEGASAVQIPLGAYDNFNAIESFAEGPLWAGTHAGTVASAPLTPGDDGLPKLQIQGAGVIGDWGDLASLPTLAGAYPSSATYDLALSGAGVFDLGDPYQTFINVAAILADHSPLAAAGGAGVTAVSFQVRTTSEDPSDPAASWSDWQAVSAGAYTARAFALRATLATQDPAITPLITQITASFDMEDRVVNLSNVSVPVAGVTIPFDPPFLSNTLHITQGPNNFPQGATVNISAKSRTGVTLTPVGTAAPVQLDLTVRGYGRVRGEGV